MKSFIIYVANYFIVMFIMFILYNFKHLDHLSYVGGIITAILVYLIDSKIILKK